MKEGLTGKFLHVFTLALLAVIVAGGAVLAYPAWRQGQGLRGKEAELRRQIEEKKREIARLKKNQERFRTDPDFVEAIARRNRRVFPGEIVFLFDD